jgi:hypothetical protein
LNPELLQAQGNHGPILDMVVVSYYVEGASCEELGWCLNSCLLHPFTVPVRAYRFASSVVTPQDYKAGGRICLNLRPLARPPIAPPPSLQLKRKRDREVDLETRERVVELMGCCFSFPSKPWLDRIGGHTRAPAKPHESRVYDGSRAHDLPRT